MWIWHYLDQNWGSFSLTSKHALIHTYKSLQIIVRLLLLAIPVWDAIWDCARSFFFFFFSATILSGPYLWNRYSQRLQIQCAAWSCGLIVHCCLPSNLLRYFFFFFFFFFRQDFVRAISLEPFIAETPNWACCLVLRSNFALLLTIQFASLSFFFSATILSGPYLWNRYSQRLQIECAAWSGSLILHCCLPSNSLRYFFFSPPRSFFFPPRFCPGHSLR